MRHFGNYGEEHLVRDMVDSIDFEHLNETKIRFVQNDLQKNIIDTMIPQI